MTSHERLAGFKAEVTRADAQALVEYSLILGLVATFAILVVATMGTQVNNIFANVSGQLAQIPANGS